MKKHLLPILLVGGMLFLVVVLLLPDRHKVKTDFSIGVINPNPGTQAINKGFVARLEELALEKGWNLSFTTCSSKDKVDAELQDMVDREVDLIFSVTTPVTKKVKKAIEGKTIPAVFAIHDPVQSGVTQSLLQPGGNLTGIQIRGGVPKTLDWMLAIDNTIQTIYAPIKFDTKATKQSLEDLEKAAQSVGIRLVSEELQDEAGLENALRNLPEGTDALFLLHSILISSNVKKIAETAIQHKLVTGSALGKADRGILISFSPKQPRMGAQAARLASLILQGGRPADIPTEITDFFLTVNLDTAKKIGISVSNDVLTQADQIIY